MFVSLCFRVTTIYLNVNQASVETEARGVPPNQLIHMNGGMTVTKTNWREGHMFSEVVDNLVVKI